MNLLSSVQHALASATFSAILFAVLGAILALFSFAVSRHFEARRSRSKTEANEFQEAISSDHLPTLGTYLREMLGEVGLSEYLDDDTSRTRVNRYLRRLDELVQVPEEEPVQVEADAPLEATNADDLFPKFAGDPPAIVSAVDRIRDGDTWTGLASLRRDIEQRLTTKFPISDPRKGPPYKYIPDRGVREIIKRFWYLASRAIHGHEVADDEVWTALNLAREIYHFLDKPAVAEHDPNLS